MKHRRKHKRIRFFLGGRRRRNPGLGLGLLGNPRGRKRHRRPSRRLFNPAPLAAVKGAFKPAHLINTAAVAGGFILGAKLIPMINRPAIMQKARRVTGLVHVALGALLGAFGKKEAIKSLGVGLAAAGAYDVIAVNIPQIGLPMLGTDITYQGEGGEVDERLQVVGGADIPRQNLLGFGENLDIVGGEDDYDI